ncbi:hypothetical protein EOL70_19790 [Leucothrix sargassi]|nr:hypothetical protein EOL70_19790 [Leucothrix sargassi]
MTDKRLLYRVILKLMAAAGIIALLFVFLNATFNSRDDLEEEEPVISSEPVILPLASVEFGKVTTVNWENNRVAVVERSKQAQTSLLEQSNQAPDSTLLSLETHPWRSANVAYFVYFDKGDSGYCPLFHDKGSFKDTCSGVRYDVTGRQEGGTKTLSIPPHYFTSTGTLVVGRWRAD